jgi:branched-chain amino acid transport system substrate-binding protein
MKRFAAATAMACLTLAAFPAAAQQKLKIGYVSSFSGPGALLGQHQYDGFMLALEHMGGKLGGLQPEIRKEDDQGKPDVAVKIARQMVEHEKVDFLTGFVFSNVLMAAVKPAIDAKTFLIGQNPGPVPLAGEQCSAFFFSTGNQNDVYEEHMAKHLSTKHKRIYLMAPNYITGRESLATIKRHFSGQVVGEVYTRLDQVDYSAELSQMRAANPDAVYVFYPGGFGINFVKQFHQAGLRGKIPLYSKATTDQTTLAAQGDAAAGSFEVTVWNGDLPNAANKKFVTDFRAKYKYEPSMFSAAAYDAAQVIDAAVRATGGKLADKQALRTAIEKVDIKSVRGGFKFNSNHYPQLNQYLTEVVKGPNGLNIVTRATLAEMAGDVYASKCQMK